MHRILCCAIYVDVDLRMMPACAILRDVIFSPAIARWRDYDVFWVNEREIED